METVDFFIRNQVALFALMATVAVLSLYVIRRLLYELEWKLPFDLGTYGGTAGAGAVRISVGVLLKSLTRRQASYLAVGFFLAISAIGIANPVPQSTGLSLPSADRDLPQNKKLLLFFHGWAGDASTTWQQFPGLVEEDPVYREFNVLVISYPTFFARRNLGVRAMARWLNDGLERNGVYERYQQIWMVSHSMGGLIAREVLIANRLRRDNTAYRLLIEIATPHQGAQTAPLARALGVSRGFVDDLTPGSSFLTNLREDWNQLRDRPRTFCLTSPQDAVVTDESAIAQCDEYLRYPQWGHVEMVKPSGRRDDRYAVPMSRVVPKGA